HAIRSPIDRRAIRAKPGDLIWLEPGVYIKDYVGCMIRMVFLGNPPKEITDAFNTTLEAYHRLIDEIEPGKTSH
ncbi:MAG: M24 family metallopeptidase, partial [Nitrospinaceae bacterium]|nr:aminopeptidase P family protein [Nitrospinaceae bacterium]NIR53804.1 aminopeptidase P family protein [Nitrospinaceae bacterium]NIS84215.1 aminopeptidase P family protein [Nitrospinaceae bacterium]NIT81021.1 aminopeptidase P family protein [Nitrospinaceae bacterium]NIU43310.1 aminopeptidase P family protein [Nitrospinaceae bacterium]